MSTNDDDPKTLGEAIVCEIIKQGMFTIKDVEGSDNHVIVWNGNTYDQLEAVVSNWLSKHPICE